MIKTYYIAKIIHKLHIPSFNHCNIDKTAKISTGSALAYVEMGKYSYTGGNTHITDAKIGKFCSIGGSCSIGGGVHPMNHVSTSPVFLSGKNIMHKNLAHHSFPQSETVQIGNDVWIGDGVFIKAGVSIGSGAIIGAHAVVTKDVEPYTVVAGVPAKEIRKRFAEEIIKELMAMKWWDWSDEELIKYGDLFDSPEKLIEKVKSERK